MTDLSALVERLRQRAANTEDHAGVWGRTATMHAAEKRVYDRAAIMAAHYGNEAVDLRETASELERLAKENAEALAAIDAMSTRGPEMSLPVAVKCLIGLLAGTETELSEAESALAEAKGYARLAFVEGAAWWEFTKTNATMWTADRDLAEAEAARRYPGADWPTHRDRVIEAEYKARQAEPALAQMRADYDEAIRVAGEALGTDPDMRSIGCVHAVCTYLAQMREERDRLLKVCEWYEQEITKRFACVRCGEEPHRGSDLYSTVCPSCRRCYRCAEPSCPTCGDAEGMRQRAVQAAADNDRLRALMAASLRVECSEACRREVGKG